MTQPLSGAYSHPAYPLGVWGGGGAGPIPDRLEPLSHRELLFFLGGEIVSVPSGSCLRALLGASVSTHLNPICACVCVCVCTCACIHMYTPMSSPPICCQGSSEAHGGSKPKQPFILRSHLPVQAEAPVGRSSAGAPLLACIHSLVLGVPPRTLFLQVTGSKPLLLGPLSSKPSRFH